MVKKKADTLARDVSVAAEASNLGAFSAPIPEATAVEIGTLAGELARAYDADVAFYRTHMRLSPEEADRRARGLDVTPEEAADNLERIKSSPPALLGWADIQRLADHDPEEALELWEVIKAEGHDELASGHRTAKALEWEGQPWSRARFLAIRQSLRADSPPQSGIEAALIDMAAEAYSTWLELTEQATMLMSTEATIERDDLRRGGRWKAPNEVTAELIERVTRRAEQAHQRFLRTIKMLTDLRRVNQRVYVGQAGQVNVGQQQVNAAVSPEERGGRQHLPKSSAAESRTADDVSNEGRA